MPQIIVLDANLLLLLAVGLTKRTYISLHKRLQAYDETDFDILSGLIGRASGLALTPNVLTETSNLARYIKDPIRSEISAVLVRIILNSNEHLIPSSTATARPEYHRLGLTDSVLLETASLGGTLLTADHDLYQAALTARLKAKNFNHIRDLRSDFH